MNNNIGNSYRMTDVVTDKLMALYTSKDSESQWYPSFIGTCKEVRYAYRDIPFQSVMLYGRSANIYLPKAGDFIINMALHLTFNAGAGATNPSFKQDISSLFERITLFYGGSILQVIYPDQIYCSSVQDDFETANIRVDRQGLVNLANRQTLATTAQRYQFRIESFLDYSSFPVSLLADQIRVEFNLRQKTNITESTANFNLLTGLDVTDNFLRVKYAYVKKDTLNNLAKLSLSQYGLFFPYLDSIHQQNVVPAGSTQLRVLLSNIKGLVSWGCFFIRETRQVNDNTGNVNFQFTNTIPWTSFNIQDSAVKIYPAENQNDMTFEENRFHRLYDLGSYVAPAIPSAVTDYRGFFTFSAHSVDHPLLPDQLENRGYYNFSATTNCFLNVTLQAPLANECYVDVFAFHHNALNLINGTVKAFSLH